MTTDGPADRGAPETTSALRTYIEVLRRRKLVVAMGLFVGLLIGAALAARQDTSYQATSEVVLSRSNLASSAVTGTVDPTAYASDFLRIVQTQANVARSPEVARRVVAAVPDAGLTYRDFLSTSSAQPERDADMLTFSVTNANPRLAERLATAYAQAFVAYRRFLDSSAIASARAQLGARIKRLRQGSGASNKALVDSLVSKEQQLRTLQVLQTANATVTADAAQAQQISPRYKRSVMLGVLLGIMFAVAGAWAREALDTRMRTARDVEGRLGLAALAEIGAPPSRNRDGVLMLSDPRSPGAEAFRVLRTNLGFSLMGGDVKSIMVTSSVEREGKTTTIANLAVTMARAGSRVALVDLDLRRPRVASAFALPPGPGFTSVALGHAALEDALVTVDLPAMAAGGDRDEQAGRLDVLRSGPLPPDPGEFVGSNVIAELLQRLRDDYDYVLIDAPPVLQVGDAMTLSASVDALFVVTRIGLVRRPMLDALQRALAVCPARVLGIVATGAAHGQGYGYGYGYGYGHGKGAAPDVAAESERSAAGV